MSTSELGEITSPFWTLSVILKEIGAIAYFPFFSLHPISIWVSLFMMRIFFYETASGKSPIKRFIDALPEEDQARFIEVYQEIEKYGLASVRMVFKQIMELTVARKRIREILR
jgi:hypothetical protein